MFALALAVKCFMDGCSHECSAHALLGHKVALVSTESVVVFFFPLFTSPIYEPCLEGGAKHVIPSPSCGSGMDSELVADIG